MQTSRPTREFWYATAAGVVIALVCYLVPVVAVLVAEIEYRSLDWRFHVRGPLPPHPELVIVAIDEPSLREVGQWPWPRRTVAELLEATELSRPRLVAVDVLFSERGERGGDAILAATLRRHSNIYLPLFITNSAPADWLFNLPSLACWQGKEAASRQAQVAADLLYRFPGLTAPLPDLCAAAQGLGIVELVGSGDGVYRDCAFVGRTDAGLVPSMPLVLAAAYLGVDPAAVQVIPGERIQVGAQSIPMDIFGLTPINFAGPAGTYPHVPAHQVLAREPAALAKLRSKVVLVGATAAGLYDLQPSPYDATFPGVEALANATANLLDGRTLRFVPETKRFALSMLLVIGVAAQVGLLPGLWGWAGGLSLLLAYWVLATFEFSRADVVLPLVPTTASSLGAIGVGLAAKLRTAEQRQRRALQVFSRFVPPNIAEQLVDADVEAAARGRRRVVTVLFGDIRHSSVYAGRLSPEDFVEALNHFFAESHAVVWRHGGTLDKFLGDGVLAFFNAPTDQPDHALRAVRAGLDLVEAIRTKHALWEYYGLTDLQIGVGIATGEVIVGYVGSERRMQYTVIGSTVNLASRLQDLARDLNVEIVVSEETYAQVAKYIEAEDLGAHVLRGFEEPVRGYRILNLKDRGGNVS